MTRQWTWLERFWPRALALVLAPVGLGVLGQVWEVRRVQVEGVHRFDPAAVTSVVEDALGKPPLLASASALRERLRSLPWVADAQVWVGLDGTVRCWVQERVPAAVLADHEPGELVDGSGQVLGPATGTEELPRLVGFAAHLEELGRVLPLLPTLAAFWGDEVVGCRRLGARDLAVSFARGNVTVLLDPQRPEALREARQVLTAWNAAQGSPVSRLDVRVPGRVFVEVVASD